MCCGGRGRALVSPELGWEKGNGQNIITTGANTEMWKIHTCNGHKMWIQCLSHTQCLICIYIGFSCIYLTTPNWPIGPLCIFVFSTVVWPVYCTCFMIWFGGGKPHRGLGGILRISDAYIVLFKTTLVSFGKDFRGSMLFHDAERDKVLQRGSDAASQARALWANLSGQSPRSQLRAVLNPVLVCINRV